MIETGHISKHSFGKDLSFLDSKAHSDQCERAHIVELGNIFFFKELEEKIESVIIVRKYTNGNFLGPAIFSLLTNNHLSSHNHVYPFPEKVQKHRIRISP